MTQAEKISWIQSEIGKLDYDNDLSIWAYGAETQESLNRFSRMFTSAIQNIDVQGSLNIIEGTIKKINENETHTKSLAFGFQKDRGRQKYYSNLISYMNKMSLQLQLNQVAMVKCVSELDQLKSYINNCIEEFDLLILDGQEYIDSAEKQSTDNEEKKEWTYHLKKRLEELQYSRLIAEQGLGQTVLMIHNGEKMIDQIRYTVTNTIPMWRNQVAIAAGLLNMRKSLEDENNKARAMMLSVRSLPESARKDYGSIRQYDAILEKQLVAVREAESQLQTAMQDLENSVKE